MAANDYTFLEHWYFPGYSPEQVYAVLANATLLRPFDEVFARLAARPLREAYEQLAAMLEGRLPRRARSTTMRTAHTLLEPLSLSRRSD